MPIDSGRIPPLITRNKPRVVLSNKQFPFVNILDIGDKGQLEVKLQVDSLRMRMDEDDVERQMITLIINDAKLITEKNARTI